MGHSLVYWVQGLVQRKLMREGGRIYAMTSSGGTRVAAQLWRGLSRQSRARIPHPPVGDGAGAARDYRQRRPRRRHRHACPAQDPRQ